MAWLAGPLPTALEMIKNVHVFLVKGVKSLMSSHLGSPVKNIGWFDSNSLSRTYVQQIKNGALMHTVHSLSLLIIHTLILLAIQYSKHPIDKNIESNHQPSELWISVIWGLTSLLVATLLKLMLKLSAISDSYKSYPFLCNTSKKRAVTWLLRCKH